MAESDPMGSQVAGSNDLQGSIDRLGNDIGGLTTAIQGMNNNTGTTTSPAVAGSFAAQGVTFTGAGGGSNAVYNGSGGIGGVNPFSMGGVLGGGGGLAQGIVNGVTDVANGVFKMGAQQQSDQSYINTYGYTQAGFWNVSSQSTISTNFGGGAGRGLYQNNLATSASDAYYGGQILSQISGQANYTAPAGAMYGRGNAPYQLAAATGLANPGLGMTGSAGVASAFYNPSTSYNLMMMGIANTPLSLGTGKANSITGVESAIGQRFGFQGFNSKTGAFNSQSLSANLDNPLFIQQMMTATGMTSQQYQQWAQQWGQLNTWSNASGKTMNQLQNDISSYMNGGQGAKAGLADLRKIPGFNMSLLQSLTQAQAGQTASEASGNAAFTKGLQAATDAINRLTNLLSGGMQALEGGAGAAAGVSSLNNSGVSGAGAGGFATSAIAAIAGLTTPGGVISQLNKDAITLNDYTGAATGNYNATQMGTNNPSPGGGGGGTGFNSSNSSNQNMALAQKLAAQMGYPGWASGSQWNAWKALWTRESSWSATAKNPSSGAYGIAQALGHAPGATVAMNRRGDNYPTAAANPPPWGNSDPTDQIIWGINYIQSTYGSPQGAWNHEESAGWYADGTTSAKPGLALVGERGPELVSLAGGQGIISAAQTAKMLQPSFGGGMYGGSGGTMAIIFQSGAITLHNTGGGTSGYHTSNDVQSNAQQLEQAIETLLKKNTTLRNIANGVTG